jgi:signal transduction histidine kinase
MDYLSLNGSSPPRSSPAALAAWRERLRSWLATAHTPVEPALLAEHLRASYTDYLFNSPVVIAISLYFYLMAEVLPPGKLLDVWMLCWMVYLSGRCLAGACYPRHRTPDPVALGRWSKALLFMQLADSLLVSALGLFIYPQLDLVARSAVLVATLVLVTATALSMSARWLSMLVYAPLIYFSFAWATWSLDQMYARGLSIFILALFGLYIFYGFNQRKTVMQGFELARRNGELAQELRIKNAELQEVAAGRSRLLATVSHDLRQPAHAIGMLCERSLVESDPESLKASLGDLNELSQSLSASLTTLMDLTRLDAGLVKATLRPVSLGQVLLRLEAEFAGSAKNKGLQLHVATSNDWVRSDPVLLHGILANLVSNAIKYSRKGRVDVELEREGDHLTLCVRDTGLGIREDKLELIFKEFVRLEGSESGTEGLGLGLSIVRRYASLLGHALSVSSQAEVGSCFSIRMPVIQVAASPTQASARTSNANDARLQGLSVLVVDNVDLVLSSMARTLRGWGCTVHAAHSLAEACAVIEGKALDVLISDFHLGDEEPDGLALIRHLRTQADRRWAGLPALLMTGDVSSQLEAEAGRSQVGVLHKPVRPAVLQHRLLSLVHPSLIVPVMDPSRS